MANNVSQFYLQGVDNLSPMFTNLTNSVNRLQQTFSGLNGANANMSAQLQQQTQHLGSMSGAMNNLGGTIVGSMLKTHMLLKVFDVLDSSFNHLVGLFRTGIEVNIETEKTMLGVAATLSTVYEFRDAISGIKLEGAEKFNEAIKHSESIMRRLTISAITTAASVKDVREAFSAAVALGANMGLKPEQIERMSTMVANASKVFGLQEGQAAQELRTILTGKIDKTATIGTALGLGTTLKKEFQDALATGGDTLANFMDKVLGEYTRASETMSQRLSGMFDAAAETYKLFSKDITMGLGDELLKLKSTIIDKLFVIDKEKGIYKWSDDLMPLMGTLSYIGSIIGETIVSGLQTAVKWAIDLGKYFEAQPQILEGIIGSISVIWNLFESLFTLVGGVFDVIGTALGSISDLFLSVAGGILGINEGLEETKKPISGIQIMLGGIITLFGGVGTIITVIGEVLQNMGKIMVHAFTTIASTIYKVFDGLIGYVLKGIVGLSEYIAELAYKIDNDLGDAVTNLSKKIKNTLETQTSYPKWMQNIIDMKEQVGSEIDFSGTKKSLADLMKSIEGVYDPQTNGTAKGKKSLKDALDSLGKYNSVLSNKAKSKPDLESGKTLENAFQSHKKYYDSQLKLWDMYNSYGLVEIETYYNRKNELEQESFEKEKADLIKLAGFYGSKISKSKNGEDGSKLLDKQQDALRKLQELEENYYFKTQQGWLDKRKSLIEYQSQIDEFKAQIFDMQGFSDKAIDLKFKIEIQGLNEKYKNNDVMLGQIKEYEITKGIINDKSKLDKKFTIEQESNQNILEDLNIKRNNSLLGEIDYFNQLKSANEDYLITFKESLLEREALYQMNPGDMTELNKINQLKNKLMELEATADPIRTKFNQLFEESFSNNLISIIDRTKSIGDAFKDLTKSIEQEMMKLVAKQLFKDFMNLIAPSGGSGGGMFDSVGGFASGLIGMLGGRATGGSVGGPVMVGESGPELFFPQSKGFIMNTPKTNDYINNQKGQVQPVFNINVQATDLQSFRNSEAQLASIVQKAVSKGNRVN